MKRKAAFNLKKTVCWICKLIREGHRGTFKITNHNKSKIIALANASMKNPKRLPEFLKIVREDDIVFVEYDDEQERGDSEGK